MYTTNPKIMSINANIIPAPTIENDKKKEKIGVSLSDVKTFVASFLRESSEETGCP